MLDPAMFTHAEAEALIETLDPAVFKLDTQTDFNDKKMLLALQALVRNQKDGYVYVEVGSWMGGTLVPKLMDRKCRRVVSIDKRPAAQADERGVSWYYVSTSTQMMIDRLESALPSTAMAKLETYDYDACEIPEEARREKFDLGFIDGEHTNRAAFQDFVSLLPFAQPDSIIAFHDANLVIDAISNVEAFLRHQGLVYESVFLPKVVFAVFLGSFAALAGSLRSVSLERESFIMNSKLHLWDEIAKSRQQAA
jgi:hypothetical protein